MRLSSHSSALSALHSLPVIFCQFDVSAGIISSRERWLFTWVLSRIGPLDGLLLWCFLWSCLRWGDDLWNVHRHNPPTLICKEQTGTSHNDSKNYGSIYYQNNSKDYGLRITVVSHRTTALSFHWSDISKNCVGCSFSGFKLKVLKRWEWNPVGFQISVHASGVERLNYIITDGGVHSSSFFFPHRLVTKN